ncbi:MAG: 2-C-methyl-D-erythritol 4-phosphate cytidylyltransferase [Desulfatiglandaceae bacterium]
MNTHLVQTVAIIPAAGSGTRMESDRAKQFLDLDGVPLLAVTLKPFQSCPDVHAIILVVPSADVDLCRKEIVERFKLDKVTKVVPGGKRRQDSVRLGLEATEGGYGLVLIHDGVRPMIGEELIERVVAEARTNRAVITALPVKETIKEVNNHREVVKTYDRQRVWLVQTPQVFRYKDILAAHQEALREEWEEASDDSLLVERMGISVKVVEGSEKNIKVTTPHDLEVARFLLNHG